MKPISFKRHLFPPDVIRYAVRLYYRFTPSFRDVEDLLAERGVDVTYEKDPLLGEQLWSNHRYQYSQAQNSSGHRLVLG